MPKFHHAPRKRFGQHFLHDKNTIDKIIVALSPQPKQHWLEIGPGQGALTLPILARIKNLDAIELDRDLIANLKKITAPIGNLRLFQGDALRFEYAQLYNGQKLRIFGNLPYNISTPLIFHLLEFTDIIQDMHFMLQKEVAERISSTPGNKEYGALSVMLQYYCDSEILFYIAPDSFFPPPKVDSAFVRLIPRPPKIKAESVIQLRNIVRQAFNQRRKMIMNSLKDFVKSSELLGIGILPEMRPEQLTVEDFVKISNIVQIRPL